ncbi:MAG: LexA family protein [Oscillospiraceae bacterium]
MSAFPVSLFGKGDFYILRAKGDSMVDAGIAEGDLLVIERNCPASEGDIVVALDQEQQNTLKGTLASTTTKSALSLLTRMKHGIRKRS